LGTNFLSLERLRLPLCLCVVHALFRGPCKVTHAHVKGAPPCKWWRPAISHCNNYLYWL